MRSSLDRHSKIPVLYKLRGPQYANIQVQYAEGPEVMADANIQVPDFMHCVERPEVMVYANIRLTRCKK